MATDIVERMILQTQESTREPIVIDVASWCIGTLPPGERRNKVSILGAINDWIAGLWVPGAKNGSRFDNVVTPPEYLIKNALDPVFEDSRRLARGEEITSPAKPNAIRASDFSIATLAATMAAAVGMKTRFRTGGNNGWSAIWAEADPRGRYTKKENGTFSYDEVWGYHMVPAEGASLEDQPVYPRYGVADIWDAYFSAIRDGRGAERGDPPPAPGQTLVTILPDSWEGIKGEIARMADTAVASVDDPEVEAFAQYIVDNMPEELRGDPRARVEAAYRYLRSLIQYRDDPWGREVIQTPARMIRMAQVPPVILGAVMLPIFARRKRQSLAETDVEPVEAKIYEDCDGQTLLTATTLKSKPIGVDTRFDLGGTLGIEGMHHIWTGAKLDGEWTCLDSTEPEYDEVGKCPAMQKLGHVDIPWK